MSTPTEKLTAALREIAKAEGPYSRDPLTHAGNTIESMTGIATRALAEFEAAMPDDYRILAEAVEASLSAFIHEDDVAEVAIYADAIERAGRHIADLESQVAALNIVGINPVANVEDAERRPGMGHMFAPTEQSET